MTEPTTPPPPPPPPLYNPNRTRITAGELRTLLSDVPATSTDSNYNNYPRHYGARRVNTIATNNAARQFDLREYAAFSVTY
jgi:hypothetical protein